MRWIALCGLFLLAGCGWSTAPVDQDQAVRDAIENYRDAWLKVDQARVCAAFSAAARTELEDSIGHPCAGPGSTYIGSGTAEQIRVRLWHISSIVVRGDRATVRFAPDPHLEQQRQALVREPGGWKLDRRVSDFAVESDWAHCVSKYVGDLDAAPEWHRLGLDVIYDYAERWCADIPRLPVYPVDAEYDRLRETILDRMVAEGKLAANEAQPLRP